MIVPNKRILFAENVIPTEDQRKINIILVLILIA